MGGEENQDKDTLVSLNKDHCGRYWWWGLCWFRMWRIL